MDWIKALHQISILIGIWVAIYGIDSWRREHIEKRKIELAEDTLALFYESADAIKHIRHPTSFKHETEEVQQVEGENEAQFMARKKAYVVFHRFETYKDLFSKIHASRYRFMSQIGVAESAPFDELREVTNEIKFSAHMLARLWPREDHKTDEQWEKHWEKIDEHESVFWEGSDENDLIKAKLAKIIEDMESICKKVIIGSTSLHSVLTKRLGGNESA